MDYVAVFDGKQFDVDGETWTAHVANVPGASANSTDRRCFMLAFTKPGGGEARHLTLWASDAGMQVENHVPKLYDCVRLWLRSDQRDGEIECFK